MTGEILLWLAKSSGPSLLRTILKRKTQGVQDYLDRLATPRQVQASFPPNVTGEQLASLASRSLSAWLREEEPPVVAAWNGERSNFSELPPRLEPPLRTEDLEIPPTGLPGRDWLTFPASAFSQTRLLIPSSSIVSTREEARDEKPHLPPPDSRAEMDQSSGSSTTQRRSFLPEPVLHRTTPTSLLENQLSEYFTTPGPDTPPPARLGGPHTHLSAPSFLVGQQGLAGASVFSSPQVRQGAGGDWPEMAAHQLAERLSRFVSEEVAPTVPSLTAEPFEAPSPAEVQNIFNIQVNPQTGGITSLQDLSTQVADILREQAIQHGIDIT